MDYKTYWLLAIPLVFSSLSQASFSSENAQQLPSIKLTQSGENQLEQEIIDVIAEQISETEDPSHTKRALEKNNVAFRNKMQSVVADAVEARKKTKSLIRERVIKQNTVAKNKKNDKTGWLYIGQFSNNHWLEKTLQLGNTLPQVGEEYKIIASVNVRSAPPSKRKMSDVIKTLSSKNSVQLVKLRRSGKQGHYWAEITW